MNPFWHNPDRVRDWLAQRSATLGSSDAPAICGVSPWATPADVYVQKVAALEGRQPDEPEPLDMNNPMHCGHLYEPVIARAYELTTGRELIQPDRAAHDRYPFITASADRMDPTTGEIVELKKVSWRNAGEWGESGTDHIPENYIVQAQEQLAVYDTDVCNVVALIGENDLRVYPIRRNADLVEIILEKMCDFWGRVERREPPPVDYATATPRLLNQLRPPRDGVIATLGDDVAELCAARERSRQAAKDATDNADGLLCQIIAAMGDASVATARDYTIKRTTRQRAGYTVKPSEYVETRIKRRDA